jgi:hypothetical protein
MIPFEHTAALGNARQGLAELLARKLAACPRAPDERAFHEDLPALTTAALHRERQRLHLALLLWDRPDSWVLGRVAHIDYELAVRRAR